MFKTGGIRAALKKTGVEKEHVLSVNFTRDKIKKSLHFLRAGSHSSLKPFWVIFLVMDEKKVNWYFSNQNTYQNERLVRVAVRWHYDEPYGHQDTQNWHS